MTESVDLENELWALGRTMIIEPPPDDLVERVLGRISMPAPRRSARIRSWLTRSRRRLVALIIAVLIIGFALTPPGRAVVRQWLQLGGIVIRTAPPPVTGATPAPSANPAPPPRTGRTVTLPQARGLVAFPIGVPGELDSPGRISVADDRRVVSMEWASGSPALHLDQFDGELSWVFVKQARVRPTFVDVAGQDAVWFAEPHPIVYVDSAGVEHTEQARTAGPCLIWLRVVDGRRITNRLEGQLTMGRAITIAESVR